MNFSRNKRLSKHLTISDKEKIVNLFYCNNLQFEKSKYHKLKKIAEKNGIFCTLLTIRSIMLNWQINRKIFIYKY